MSELELPIGEPKDGEPKDGEPKDPITNFTLKDVQIGEVLVPFKRLKKKNHLTEENSSFLESIGGVLPAQIQVLHLRKFCVRVGIPGKRVGSKLDCIKAIIKATTNPPPKRKEESNTKNVRLNRNRYCNVLFSDMCRNDVANRGQSLTAAEMTAGLKTNELLHKKICQECNKYENSMRSTAKNSDLFCCAVRVEKVR